MDTSGTGTYRSPLVRKQRFIGFNDPHNSKDHPKDLEIQQRLLDLDNAKRCYETSEGSEDALPVLLFKCADALHYHPEIYLPGFMEKGVCEFVVAVVMDASLGPEATNAALTLLNNVVFNNVKPPLDVSSGILERVFGLLQTRCVDPRIASLVINNLLDRNGPLAEVFVANGFDGFIDMILERRKEDVHGLAVLVPMLSLRDLPMPLEKRIRIFEALPKMLEAHALWQFADSVDLLLDFPDREIVSRIYGPSGLYRDLCTVAVAHPSEHTLAALVHLIKKMPDEISITAIPYAQLASIARSDNSAVSILALKALRRFVRVGGSAAVTSLGTHLRRYHGLRQHSPVRLQSRHREIRPHVDAVGDTRPAARTRRAHPPPHRARHDLRGRALAHSHLRPRCPRTSPRSPGSPLLPRPARRPGGHCRFPKRRAHRKEPAPRAPRRHQMR